jgi:hypothetical protein
LHASKKGWMDGGDGAYCLICRRKKKRTGYSRNAPQGPPSYISQSSLQQHLEPYPTINSLKFPPIVEDICCGVWRSEDRKLWICKFGSPEARWHVITSAVWVLEAELLGFANLPIWKSIEKSDSIELELRSWAVGIYEFAKLKVQGPSTWEVGKVVCLRRWAVERRAIWDVEQLRALESIQSSWSFNVEGSLWPSW